MTRNKTICVIDAETDPFKVGRTNIRPFVWGFYDGAVYKEFWNTVIKGKEFHDCTQKLIDYLDTREDKLIIYAHNGGKFDFHFMLPYLKTMVDIKIINGRITKAKMKEGGHELRDSYALLPVPLSAYKKDDIDYDLMLPTVRYIPAVSKQIAEYLKTDCVYLFEMVTRFIDKYGMHLTMASASMKRYEKMTADIMPGFKAPRTNGFYYEKFKHFYYGGRVQCFETGIIEQRFKFVDINSAYPYAMLHKHPIESGYFEHGPIAGRRLEKVLSREYIGNLFFDVDAISYGALPFRAEDKALHFPADGIERRYKVSGWEIRAGLETGSIKVLRAHNIYEFDLSGCDDFAHYIEPIYKERQESKRIGDKAMALFSKLFMNSLYGKWGANPDAYKHFMAVPADMKDALMFGPVTPEEINFCEENELDPWRFGGELGEYCLAEKPLEDNEKVFYNVATAASITGFVRAYLWRAICEAREPLYCDTDSIAAVDFGPLSMGGELGQWDYVAADDDIGAYPFEYAAIGGRKMYAFRDTKKQWKTASKGVRLSVEELLKVAKGETIIYNPLAPTFSVKKAPVQTARKVRLTKR